MLCNRFFGTLEAIMTRCSPTPSRSNLAAHGRPGPIGLALVLLTLGALPLGSALGFGCKGGDPAKRDGLKTGDSDAPVPVEVVKLAPGPIEDSLRFSSTLRAETQVAVLARTVGQIRQRNVEEGDVVTRNQILARIEADEQSSAISRINSDLALATKNLTRDQELHKQGVVSETVLERSKSELERLQIARRDARRSLGYTTVRAPIAGMVTMRSVKYGDLVTPNQPLFEITDFNSLVAEVFVPEKDIGRVSVGTSARLRSPGADADLTAGTVLRISPVVDPRSGTVKVTLDLKGAPKAAALRPGMFVDVHLVVAKEDNALLLPRRALIYDNDEPYVFLVNDGVAKRIRVDIELEDREFVKPASGFAAGDQVVVAGQVGLKDGAKVKDLATADEATDKNEKPVDPIDPGKADKNVTDGKTSGTAATTGQ